MTVQITSESQGLTHDIYFHMLGLLAESLKQAPGFVLHTAHPIENGWRIIEVWNSKEDANRFFANNVAPNLPQGIRPKRSVQELQSLLLA